MSELLPVYTHFVSLPLTHLGASPVRLWSPQRGQAFLQVLLTSRRGLETEQVLSGCWFLRELTGVLKVF